MFTRLLLLFTILPLIELFVLVHLGQVMGLGPTIALVLLTGALGAWLARQQGLRTLGRLRADLAAGRLPAEALVEGVLILLAGAVLLTPGLLTDLAGFAILTPPIRSGFRRWLSKRWSGRLSGSTTWTTTVGPTDRATASPAGEAPRVLVIEPEDPPESGSSR